jgi:VanZ family protein
VSGQSSPGLFLLGLVLCTAFGVLDELYQQLIPGRGFEWIDIAANTIGSAFGIFVFAKKGMADKVMLTGSS